MDRGSGRLCRTALKFGRGTSALFRTKLFLADWRAEGAAAEFYTGNISFHTFLWHCDRIEMDQGRVSYLSRFRLLMFIEGAVTVVSLIGTL